MERGFLLKKHYSRKTKTANQKQQKTKKSLIIYDNKHIFCAFIVVLVEDSTAGRMIQPRLKRCKRSNDAESRQDGTMKKIPPQ